MKKLAEETKAYANRTSRQYVGRWMMILLIGAFRSTASTINLKQARAYRTSGQYVGRCIMILGALFGKSGYAVRLY